jgi:hypothetical protein
MTTHAPNATARLRVSYEFRGGKRTITFRMADGVVEDAFVGGVHDLFAANLGCFDASWVTLGADFSAAETDFSFPVAFPVLAGTGSMPTDPFFDTQFFGLAGRSVGGTRVQYHFYGCAGQDGTPDRYRITPAAENVWGNLLNDMADFAATGDLVAADGMAPILKPYLNVGMNAYFQRKARRG